MEYLLMGLIVGFSLTYNRRRRAPRKKREGISGWMVFWAWLALAVGTLFWSM